MARTRRLPNYLTSYKHRCYSLSAKEQLDIKQYRKNWKFGCKLIAVIERMEENEEMIPAIKAFVALNLYRLQRISYTESIPPRVHRHHEPRTIASFSPDACWRRFRFKQEHLVRVMDALRLPRQGTVVLKNKCKYTLEEILLFSLNRLSYPGRLADLSDVFGREFSQWSRAFIWFIKYVFKYFRCLVTCNLPYWAECFPVFARRIRDKIVEKGGAAYEDIAATVRVAAFIDCTVIATSRPGGPDGPGQNAPRFSNFIQMAVYSGWKKHHGIKYQTVEGPNGMCLDMFGPMAFRCSDLDLFTESKINTRFRDAQGGAPRQYVMYGDGIYVVTSHCLSKGDPIMTKARISNEWDYMQTSKLWKFCKFKESNKLRMDSNIVGKQYVVATLLRNAHCCLYDGVTASYYDCPAPTLEHYFRVGL